MSLSAENGLILPAIHSVVSQFEISATIISFSQDYQLKIEYLLTGHERFQVASF
jgi:hypothetical protein